ncbi:TspO/MBR family protein [Rhodohalobacter halophilus]|uniref:TspO/MBR family protein n=1 Tax=Rhodohalobacter halophilus TaxID=1812810 RepID=UPI00083F82C1|nr:TspO/MBR family protein [Rhodohalobacter halophilus]
MRTSNLSLPVQITGFILFLALCYLIAWTGALVSPGIASPEWYNSLNKPDWNPPAWLFGPVWTTLYTLMGISAWLVWKEYGFKHAASALSAFFLQLILNGLWSQLFFNLQNIGWALIEIILLLTVIFVTTHLFYQKNKIAGWLLIPYILWVSFATALTAAIWVLN